MYESIPIIAFDQHAASVTAAVLLPGHRTPALHQLSPDLPTIGRFVARVGRSRASGVVMKPGRAALSSSAFSPAARSPCDVIAPASDSAAAGRSHQDGPPRCGPPRGALSRRDARRRFMCRPSRKRRRAICSGVARTFGRICCAPGIGCPSFCCGMGAASRARRRRGRSATTSGCARRRGRCRRSTRPTAPISARVDEAVARLRTVETELRDLLTLEPLQSRVTRLRCFRGIDDLTALTIAAELGDPRRFPTAPSTMAFVGLVPSEHSSGTKRARGAITKTGNAHLRRVLIEAAWHYRHHPFVGRALRRRQHGAPDAVVQRAWAAQQRLHHRYRRLAGRGKPKQHVVTAVARELTGFVWDVLTR